MTSAPGNRSTSVPRNDKKQQTTGVPALGPVRVLLADDTLIAREGWKAILETAQDIEVVGEAVTAQEVGRSVQQLCPNVVLMDLKWFGDQSAGWAAIREVKELAPDVRVIAITAYDELIRDARAAGADAALTKEFTREGLLTLIREVAHRERQFPAPAREQHHYVDLTAREREVLVLLARGDSDRAIAERLQIAQSTAKSYVQSILTKLGADNRTHAARLGRQYGIVD